jgi:MFS family permease
MNAPETASAPSQASSRIYYGWIVLLVAAAAMVGTLPGRTQGLGLITKPMLSDLQLSQLRYAELNFWTTIAGSLGAIGIGHLIDRLGSRAMLTAVAVSLGAVVCGMSQTTTFAGLAIWSVLIRALGQSALSVVSLTIVGKWFVRKIDVAMAVYSVVMSLGFMMAFPAVGSLIQQRGWRTAWLLVGLWLIAVLAPLGWALMRRGPEQIGLSPDGDSAPTSEAPVEPRNTGNDYTWLAALRTPAFWVFALGTSLYGLVASGIGLFNESILAQRGFGPDTYYLTLVVTAMTGLIGNFGGGWIAPRVRPGALMALSLFVLAAGLAFLPHVTTRMEIMAWATAMGLGGGLVMVLFFSVWPRLFGRSELGRIQGVAQACTVLASAIGPVLLEWYLERTGSYSAILQILAFIIAIVGTTALIVPTPSGHATASTKGAGRS